MQHPQPKKIVNNFAFIDSQNVNLGIRSSGWKLDFSKLIKFLKNKFKITQAFIFIGRVEENYKLYQHLENCGYKIIFKPTIKDFNGKIKGNCDAELVLHTMIEYQNYDKAVIVSGDGDFGCLVEYLEKQNKLERLVIPNREKYSFILKKFKDKSYLSDMKEILKRED